LKGFPISEKQGVGSSILPLATGFFPSVYKTGTYSFIF
jgi:hypothetical protein